MYVGGYGGLSESKDYLLLISADWKHVMFSDESNFRMVRRGSKLVRSPLGSSRIGRF